MTVAILWVGGSAARWQEWGEDLKDAGYMIVHASSEKEAVEVVKSRRVAVVCIDSTAMLEEGNTRAASGARLRDANPCVPVILVQRGAAMPEHYEKDVDVVVDEETFAASGRWLIEELREVRFPLFVEWFDAWKQRQPGHENKAVLPDS